MDISGHRPHSVSTMQCRPVHHSSTGYAARRSVKTWRVYRDGGLDGASQGGLAEVQADFGRRWHVQWRVERARLDIGGRAPPDRSEPLTFPGRSDALIVRPGRPAEIPEELVEPDRTSFASARVIGDNGLDRAPGR
jgi:hypothetical protein